MKKQFLLFSLLCVTSSLFAQEESKQSDITISPYYLFSEPSHYGLSFELNKGISFGSGGGSSILQVAYGTMTYDERNLEYDGTGYVIELGSRSYFKEKDSGVYTQSGAVYASAGFYDTSDMRVKDNIESIDVSKADKIRLVEFDRTDREHHGYGVIAQELETVYPSMVNTDENGFKTVNYSEIYAVKIKYLEDKIAALEAVVDKLISK